LELVLKAAQLTHCKVARVTVRVDNTLSLFQVERCATITGH